MTCLCVCRGHACKGCELPYAALARGNSVPGGHLAMCHVWGHLRSSQLGALLALSGWGQGRCSTPRGARNAPPAKGPAPPSAAPRGSAADKRRARAARWPHLADEDTESVSRLPRGRAGRRAGGTPSAATGSRRRPCTPGAQPSGLSPRSRHERETRRNPDCAPAFRDSLLSQQFVTPSPESAAGHPSGVAALHPARSSTEPRPADVAASSLAQAFMDHCPPLRDEPGGARAPAPLAPALGPEVAT